MTIPSTYSNFTPAPPRPDSQAGWFAMALGLKQECCASSLAADAVVRLQHAGFDDSRGAGREAHGPRRVLAWLVVVGLQQEPEGGPEGKTLSAWRGEEK